MEQFEYVIRDEIGIHARPAGILVKEAKKYGSKITLSAKGKSAEVTKLIAIMSLGIKCGDKVCVQAEGADEAAAIAAMKKVFEESL